MDVAPHALEHSLLYAALACEVCGTPPEPLIRHLTDSGRDFSAFVARVRESRVVSDTQHRALERLVRDALAEHIHDSQRAAQALGMDPAAVASLRARMRSGAGIETRPGRAPAASGPADANSTRPAPHGLPEAEVLPPMLWEQPGRYVELGELGKGGIGRVMVVLDSALRRKVAFKQLLPEEVVGRGSSLFRSTSPAALRFLQEAAITAQMEHPGIVPVYEIGQRDDGSIYYTMKLVRGRTLSEAIDAAGTLEQRLALLPHFVALCQAIAYAHSLGIIHRDIKPQNVIIGEYGETVVIDWGLAKARGQQDVHARGLSETLAVLQAGDSLRYAQTLYGATVGTPAYIPPEQARGEIDRIDERSDVFGLGAVLYNLLSGQAPYEGRSLEEVLLRARSATFAPLEKLHLQIPPELIAICGRAMRANHEERYQSAGELAEEVGRFLSGALVQSYQYGPSARLLRFVRRQRAAVATAAIGLAALAVFGAYSINRVVKERDLAQAARVHAENASRRAQSSQRDAESARDAAEDSAVAAQRERERADRELYLSTISLTHSYVESGQFGNAAQTLQTAAEKYRDWEWGWLLAQCNEDLASYTPNFDPLGSALFYSMDFVHHRIARRFGEPHQRSSVQIEELETGFPMLAVAADGVNVYGGIYPRWSPDGRWLAVCNADRFRIFRPENRAYSDVVFSWLSDNHLFAVSADSRRIAYVSPDLRLTAAEVVLEAAPTLQSLGAWPMMPLPQRIAMNHEGTLVSVAGRSHAGGGIELNIFDTTQARPSVAITDLAIDMHVYERNARAVWAARTAPPQLVRFDAETGAVLREIAADSEVTVLALASDDGILAWGDVDGHVERFDLRRNAMLPLLRAHTGPLTALAFGKRDLLLASGGADRRLAVMEATGESILRYFSGHSEAIVSIQIDEDARLAASGNAKECKIWQLDAAASPLRVQRPDAADLVCAEKTQELVLALEGGGRVAVSPYAAAALGDAGAEETARRILSPDGSHELRLDTQGARLRRMPEGNTTELLHGDMKLSAAAFAMQDDSLAILAGDAINMRATLHYFREGRAVGESMLSDFRGSDALAFSKVFATGLAETPWAVLSDKRLLLLREESREAAEQFDLDMAMQPQKDAGAALSVSADSAQGSHSLCLAYATTHNDIALASIGGRAMSLRLSGHTAPVTALCFNPTGSRLVSGAANGEVRLWEADTGRLIIPLPEAGGAVRKAVWSGDGSFIALLVQNAGYAVYHAFPAETSRYPGTARLPMGARIEAYKTEHPLRRTALGAAQAALREIARLKRDAAVARNLKPGDAMDWEMLGATLVPASEREQIALGAAGAAPVHREHGPLRSNAYLYELDALLSEKTAADQDSLHPMACAELAEVYGSTAQETERRFSNWASVTPYLHGAALCLSETLPREMIESNSMNTLLLARSALSIGNFEMSLQNYQWQPTFLVGAERALAGLGTGRPEDLSKALDALLYHVRNHRPDDLVRTAMAKIAARAEATGDARWEEIERLHAEALAGHAQIAWREKLDEALVAAAAENKTLLLQVYQTRSAARAAAHELGDRPWVVRQLEERHVPCRIIMETLPEEEHAALRNRYGLYRPPVWLVLDAGGGIIEREDRPDHMLENRASDMVRAWNQTWLREWRILGPFPVTRDQFQEVLPPEEAFAAAAAAGSTLLDLHVAYPAVAGALSWRTLHANDSTGQVLLARYLRASEAGVYYAYAEIEAREAASVDVELRFSGVANIFLKGVSQAPDGMRTYTPWVVPTHFPPGKHAILLKVHFDKAMAFSVWIRDRLDCDAPLPLAPSPMPDCPVLVPLPPPAMHAPVPAEVVPAPTEAGSNRVEMELVWKEFRDEFRANPLLTVAQLNLRPVLDETGGLRGITSAHFSEVPLFSKLGLKDHDVIIQFEERFPRDFFLLDARGNLQLSPSTLNDTSGTFDRRPAYTVRILRAGRELEFVYTMLY